MDPADYVLAPFRAEEAEALAAALDEAEELILAFIENRED
jgi:peptidyl-tRNA hydrolase